MKKKACIKTVLVLSALALSTSVVFAANDTVNKSDGVSPAQALINTISKDQLTTLNTFDGPSNLTGFVLQPKSSGQPVIMYAANDGSYAVYGSLIGSDGQSLSDADKEKYVDAYVTEKILTYLPNTAQFSEGSTDAQYQMTVLADPNCSACHYFYDLVKPFIDKGKLRINWVLVAFVKPDSEAKAAAIMSADNPAVAMAANESGFDADSEEGGAKVPAKLTDEQKAVVAKNMDFMANAGLSSTPTIMFYDKHGDFKFIKGSPRDIGNFLTQVGPTDTPRTEDADV